MITVQYFSARFLVTRTALTQDAVLMQVTTGRRGEILALAVDRNWWVPDQVRPPYRYTITSWQDGTIRTSQLDGVTLRLTHVQPLDTDAFLLVSRRAQGIWDPENAMTVTADGTVRRRFSLSDGIQDVQVDLDDRIWVGYFDEGVFRGLDPASEGLVCFDSGLNPTLRFNTLASKRGLPQMYDCYALNVASVNDAYTYYYGEKVEKYFPLVHLRDGDVARVWQITAVKGAHAVAINTTHALFGGAYQHPERLTLVDLATNDSEEILATDQDGRPITTVRDSDCPLASRLIWGRGHRLYILDSRGVWQLALPIS